jgi:hypothetical protein
LLRLLRRSAACIRARRARGRPTVRAARLRRSNWREAAYCDSAPSLLQRVVPSWDMSHRVSLQAVYFGSAPLRGLTKSSPPMPPRPALGIAWCARPRRERISPAMYWAGRAATVRTGQHTLMDLRRTLFVAPTHAGLARANRCGARFRLYERRRGRRPVCEGCEYWQCHGQGNLASRSMPICSGRHFRQLFCGSIFIDRTSPKDTAS